MKVFISYNHEDKATAIKVENWLKLSGFEPIRDENAMISGEAIETFIYRAIREGGAVISLVSKNSLRSAWVTFETLLAEKGEHLLSTWWIPTYLDKEFMDDIAVDRMQDEVEEDLEKLYELIKVAQKKNRSLTHLNDQREGLRNVLHHFSTLIAALRKRGCVDLTLENFDKGLQKIIKDLKSSEKK